MADDYLTKQLMRHEGFRRKPYHCTGGKLTIGYGRNLEDKGISRAEAKVLLTTDINECRDQVNIDLGFDPEEIGVERFEVLVNMCFNLGLHGLRGFRNTLRAVRDGRWDDAADGMMDSLWARQVGQRALELSRIMRSGRR